MPENLRAFATQLETPAAKRAVFFLWVGTAIFLTIFPVARFLAHGTQFDYRTWFDAGEAVRRGQELYPRNGAFPFMYPPSCAVLLSCTTLFGKAAMIFLLCAVNTVAWITCIKCSVKLTTNGQFRSAVAVLPSFILLVFIWSSYHLGQPSLVLLALMLGAFVCLRTERSTAAGALIGLAAAIKAFPFLAIIYLVYRRFWRAAFSLLLTTIMLLFVLPLPFRGPARTLDDLHRWQSGMLHYDTAGIAQRAARGYSWKNQSLFGVANRLLRPVSVNDEGEPVQFANVADLDFKSVNAVIIGAAVLLGAIFAAAIPLRRSPPASEFAIVLILTVIVTPLAFGYLFSWSMLAFAVLIAHAISERRSFASALVAVTLLIVTAIWPKTAQIYGSLLGATLVLLAALIAQLWRERMRLLAG